MVGNGGEAKKCNAVPVERAKMQCQEPPGERGTVVQVSMKVGSTRPQSQEKVQSSNLTGELPHSFIADKNHILFLGETYKSP